MFEFLLLTGLTCSQSQQIIDRVNEYASRSQTSEAYVQEVIDVIKDDNPECEFK